MQQKNNPNHKEFFSDLRPYDMSRLSKSKENPLSDFNYIDVGELGAGFQRVSFIDVSDYLRKMFQFDVDIFQIGFFQSPRRDNMKTSIITIHNRYLSTFHSSKAEIPERWICFQAEQGLSKDPSSFNAATLQHQCFPSSQSRPSLKLTVRP